MMDALQALDGLCKFFDVLNTGQRKERDDLMEIIRSALTVDKQPEGGFLVRDHSEPKNWTKSAIFIPRTALALAA